MIEHMEWSDLGTPERMMAAMSGVGRASAPLTAA
jgi:hypothetical protein